MEKSARVAKKPLEAKVNGAEEAKVDRIGGWQRLVLAKIKSVPAAKEKWKVLTDAGVDPEELAEYLYRYCGVPQKRMEEGLKAARQFRDNIEPAVTEVRRAATTTERLLGDLRNICGIKIYESDFDRLPSTLRAFANEVDSLRPALNKTVARGVRKEKDGRITSGAGSEALSILVQLVSDVTTEPYAHLAPLVAAVGGGAHRYDDIADSLRNAFNRQLKKATGRQRIK